MARNLPFILGVGAYFGKGGWGCGNPSISIDPVNYHNIIVSNEAQKHK